MLEGKLEPMRVRVLVIDDKKIKGTGTLFFLQIDGRRLGDNGGGRHGGSAGNGGRIYALNQNVPAAAVQRRRLTRI